MAEHLELIVRLSNGTRLNVSVGAVSPVDCTVLSVKEKLADQCPVDRQRLIYKGRILEDDRTLQDYDITHKSTLFLVKGQAPATASSLSPSAAAVTAAPSSARWRRRTPCGRSGSRRSTSRTDAARTSVHRTGACLRRNDGRGSSRSANSCAMKRSTSPRSRKSTSMPCGAVTSTRRRSSPARTRSQG